MKKLLLILLCVPLIGFGQGWENTYGGTNNDIGYSVQQTTDGGYVISGSTDSYGNVDVYLIKTDGNGNEQWSKTFGGVSTWDVGYSVQQTTDGGYIITGVIDSNTGNVDVYLIKTDDNGNEQWSKTFGGTEDEWSLSVQQTTDGGYVISGTTDSYGNGVADVYLIKTDGNGNEQWSKIFGGTDADIGRSVQQTTDGGYVISGSTDSYGNGDRDVYLIKTDVNGNEQWSKTFGGTDDDWSYSVQQTTDGGYVISGLTVSFANSECDVYLIKTDGSGNEQWSKTFGGSFYDEGYSVQQTFGNGYIIVGTKETDLNTGLTSEVYLIKTDNNGNEQWSKTFGGTDDEQGFSVQQTTDGGYVISGFTASFGNGGADVYFIKTDGNGNVTSEFTIPLNSNRELKKTVDILGRDANPEKNKPIIEIYNDGTVEKKIIIE